MEFPILCFSGHENMVDLEHLERRPLNKLYTVEGFTCQECKTWKPCYFLTPQLEENMRKLNGMPPTHASFMYHFAKTMKRAEEIQRRGRNIAWQEQSSRHG